MMLKVKKSCISTQAWKYMTLEPAKHEKGIHMKKIIKRIVLAFIAIILSVVIVRSGLMFIYYPHFKQNKKAREIQYPQESVSAGEIRVMSCNLRCINPTDLGKKNWFYN